MTKNFDVIIIGAGIVGLAAAYELIKKNPALRMCIIEKENGVAKHQTGNNSGVIHSGIYYKPGSLKAVNCRRGYKMLLDFCDEYKIEYDICGKVIVATDTHELQGLNNLYKRGIENELEGLKQLSKDELKEIEPHVNGIKGVLVPQTGIIDYKDVSKKIKELLEEKGVEFRFEEKLVDLKIHSAVVEVITNRGYYEAGKVVTCAGLQSDRVAKMTNPGINIKIVPFRGEYYTITPARRSLVKNLIYPVPDPQFPFLGVHFTRMIDGKVEAGPNAVFAFKREGYDKFDIDFLDLADSLFWKGFLTIAKKFWKTGLMEFYRSYSKPAFVKSLQRLIPEIQSADLEPGGAGIRAQACDSNGNLIDDFLFVENEHIIHVCNAPSPAATSCFSIGKTIAEKVIP